jgi:exodeoxyribonuclease III
VSKDTWTLTTLNVNGLRSAVRKGFREWRPKTHADVICLQELRMQPDQQDAAHLAPRGWKSAQHDAVKRGYSGVSVWSRLPVSAAGTGSGVEEFDREGRVAWLQTDAAKVYSIYFPSGSSGEPRQVYKNAFNDHITEHLQADLDSGAPVAVCGDVNVAHTPADIWNPTGNKKNSGFLPHEREWMSGLLARGWVDVWRLHNPDAQQYSWWSNRGQARAKDRGWRIDYILASPALAERLVDARIQGRDPAVSDHCAVHATFRR